MPALALLLAVYVAAAAAPAPRAPAEPALPAVRAVTASFGNSVQLGIPMAAALFGEAGLALHLVLVSVHGLMLLALLTCWSRLDLARSKARHLQRPPVAAAAHHAAQHRHPPGGAAGAGRPAVEPAGLGLPGLVDEALQLLGSAVVPVCLVLIGLSLANYGGRAACAALRAPLKLLAAAGAGAGGAHWGLGLAGLPLSVLVMMAALPVGSNALIFAQRYGTLGAEATAAIVLSTLAFV